MVGDEERYASRLAIDDAAGCTVTSTVVPGGVCFAALPTRLASTCCSRGPSSHRGRSAGVDGERAVGVHQAGVVDDLVREHGEVDVLEAEWALPVEPGQQRQRVDEDPHPAELDLNPLHGVVATVLVG